VLRTLAQYTTPGVPSFPVEYPAAHLTKLIARIREVGVLCFDDVANDTRLEPVFRETLQSLEARSVMYAAIMLADETPAALSLASVHRSRQWSASDIALVRQVADQTGVAIRQAQLFAQAEANTRRERLINRLGAHIRRSLDLSEMLHTATHELGAAINASHVYLRTYHPARREARIIHPYAAPGATPLTVPIVATYDDPIGRRWLEGNRIIVVDDTATFSGSTPEVNEQIRREYLDAGTRSEIMYPLVVQGELRGVLCIHQTDRVRRWTQDEIALVETVAAQLATGMAQAELFEMVTRAKKEWEATFDAMSDGVFIFDNERRLARVNRAGATLEDSYPHLILGRRCCDILRAYGGGAECVVERAINEGRSTTLEVTPDRLQRPLLVTAEPIYEDGRTAGAVCIVRDLSELYEVQTEARESQSLLTNILESAREAIFALDPVGQLQWCNSATVLMSGLPHADLIGQSFLGRVAETDLEVLRASFRRALAGESLTCEVEWFTPEGVNHFALVDYAPLVIEQRTTGVLAIARDITEQKRERELAAQADKLRALGQLASGVAHDLNNSLAAILGRAQLLQRAISDSSGRQHLDIINTAAEDAAATVRRIQTFARQSQAKEFERLDARALIQDAIEITRTRWENAASGRVYHVGLARASTTEIDNVTLSVMGVASELREVFVNLIVNAIDAMPAGGRLTITAEADCQHPHDAAHEMAAGRVCLHFADTGTGMTADVRARIFEPFYTTKGADGTGLGLFVSYGIIERHGGTITVYSETDRGTNFTIDLPAAPHDVAGETTAGSNVETIASLSVLVVDDEHFVRSTLAEIVSELGHTVMQAESGAAACELLEREQFAIVFTDLSMPDMDGWEVARRVRLIQPTARTVLVTGYGSTVAPPDGEEDIITAILSKPFDFARVAELFTS
jgi:PAS domain S-box-containing protein